MTAREFGKFIVALEEYYQERSSWLIRNLIYNDFLDTPTERIIEIAEAQGIKLNWEEVFK
jgi:hypothetical protein